MLEWIVSSSALLAALIALRYLLRGRVSLRLQYALWGLALLRLLIPVSFGSTDISILNAVEAPVAAMTAPPAPVRPDPAAEPAPTAPLIRPDTEDGAYREPAAAPTVSAPPQAELRHAPITGKALLGRLARVLWLGGAALALVWLAASNLILARRLRRSRTRLQAADCPLPVYITDAVETPCLFGLCPPAVYVTSEAAADPTALRHVLAHETAHYRHGDHIWPFLRGLCLALHWYNPMAWWAAVLSRRDGELACDEAAIRRVGEPERAAYGRTLIGLTCRKRPRLLLAATTMTGSARGIGERIALIAKKPRMAAYTLAAVLLLAALAVGCTFTGARKPDPAATPEPGNSADPATAVTTDNRAALAGLAERASTELDGRLVSSLLTTGAPTLTCAQLVPSQRELWTVRLQSGEACWQPAIFTAYAPDVPQFYQTLDISGWEPVAEGSLGAYLEETGQHPLLSDRETYDLIYDSDTLYLELMTGLDLCEYRIFTDGKLTAGGVARVNPGTAEALLALYAPAEPPEPVIPTAGAVQALTTAGLRELGTSDAAAARTLLSGLDFTHCFTAQLPAGELTESLGELRLGSLRVLLGGSYGRRVAFAFVEAGAETGRVYVGPQQTEYKALLALIEAAETSQAEAVPLTEQELELVRAAFDPFAEEEDNGTNPISCCFTSYYDDPADLDLAEFLRYFGGEAVMDMAEYQTLKNTHWTGISRWARLADSPTPVWRYPAAQVEARLETYFGISLSELRGDYTQMASYLPEYDAFYNTTSDWGPGTFSCVRGQREGDTVRLYSQDDAVCLTLEQADGRWLIRSHQRRVPEPTPSPQPQRGETLAWREPEADYVLATAALTLLSDPVDGEEAYHVFEGTRLSVLAEAAQRDGTLWLQLRCPALKSPGVSEGWVPAAQVTPYDESLRDQVRQPVYLPAGEPYAEMPGGEEETHGYDLTGAILQIDGDAALLGLPGGRELWVRREALQVGEPGEQPTGQTPGQIFALARARALTLGLPLETWGAELVYHSERGAEAYTAYFPVSGQALWVMVKLSPGEEGSWYPDLTVEPETVQPVAGLR